LIGFTRGGTHAKIENLGTGDMRQLSQCHTAGIATDQYVHFLVGDQLLDRGYSDFWIFGFVRHDQFKLAAIDAALGIDLVHRNLH
jgi:hypothetical protein